MTSPPEGHVGRAFAFGKVKKLDLVASNVRKLSVSTQRPVDGAALTAKAILISIAGLTDYGENTLTPDQGTLVNGLRCTLRQRHDR